MPRLTPSLTSRLRPQPALRRRSLIALLGLAGGILVAAFVLFLPKETQNQGYLMGFDYRIRLEFEANEVAVTDTFTRFPVLVQVVLPALKSTYFGGNVSHPLGYDLRFTAADGATPLLFEVVGFQPETGFLQARVQIDTLRPNSACYLYFGNDQLHSRPAFNPDVYQWHGFYTEGGEYPALAPEKIAAWRKRERFFIEKKGALLQAGGLEPMQHQESVDYALMQANVRGSAWVMVSWASNQELDNESFEVQRSKDGQSWEMLGKLGGAKNSRDLLHYHFPDPHPFPGKTYYRIRQRCTDGWYAYSDLFPADYHPENKGLTVKDLNGLPFSDSLSFPFSTDEPELLTLELFDVKGQLVHTALLESESGPQEWKIGNLNHLPPQPYVLHLSGKDRRSRVFRIIKE